MTANAFHIVAPGEFDEAAVARLRTVGRVTPFDPDDESTLHREIGSADALVIRTRTVVTSELLDRADRLKVIGRGGVGLDNVDVAAARRRGIQVVYAPAAASDTVAEFTVGLLLALERHIVSADQMVREARFNEARSQLVGRELRGRTLGIVGMGRIGRRVGRICSAGLGMTVHYNDIVDITGLDFDAAPVDKATIWQSSDVVSLHVPLNSSTRHLVDAAALERFRPSATLINTARGAVVDTSALAAALRRGALAGAALDVHEHEPLPPDHPIISAPNVLLSPHIAARTGGALRRMNDVVDDVIAVLRGREPQFPAPEDLS